MKFKSHLSLVVLSVVLLFLVGVVPSFAQKNGTLKIEVSPLEAYAFVDGHAYAEATRRPLKLSPGEHKIELVNYGFKPATKTVTIEAGKSTDLKVNLEPVSKTVTGPWGAMTIEGADRDAVLLNGKTPDFFVGHGDEFNHDWWWKQELVVPPGKYQVTILGRDKEVWSGPVEVPANQRVVIDIPKGVRKTVPWPRGEKLKNVARFEAGHADTTVAVAKPTAQLSATTAQVKCGDSSQLKWSSADAPQVEINDVGAVAASGEKSIQPKQPTTYQLTALGPGGTATSSTTVNVDNSIKADLGLSPAEVHYKKVGDKVVEESSTALNWSAANADSVSIDPLGSVSAKGSRNLPIAPQKTATGPVDETVTYTLKASNNCGGSETRTATLRIVGSIEPEPQLAMRSIYFPTDRPTAHRMQAGLLASEKETLKTVADNFKKYLEYKPDAHLILAGHADKRGPNSYNQALSERRAQLAKDFLVEQGIPAANIETKAYGAEQNLSSAQVKQLLEQDSALSDEDRKKALGRLPTIVLANNRRVDITLTSTGQESARQYPFKAEDYAALVDRNGPTKGIVELAGQKKKMEN